MSQTESRPTHDRRTFLLGAGAALLAACTDSDTGDSDIADSGSADSEPAESGSSTSSDSITSNESDENAENTESAESAEAASESQDLAALTPAMFEALAICTLVPSATKGPFPNIERLDRRDITEGYAGHPLRLGFRVVDAACQPIPGAQVEIWHTDATGDYSAYEDNGSGKDEGEGTNFCRGIQTANADGIGEFQTIYPGWYEGRAVHIHATILVDGQERRTTQLYFDEAYTEGVYATGEYAKFGLPDTPWSRDRIVGDPATDGSGISLAAAQTSLGQGTLGLINLGI